MSFHEMTFSVKAYKVQIVCGSEYTLCLLRITDAVNPNKSEQRRTEAQLWACGWNEHGNLGTGDALDVKRGWRSVMTDLCVNEENVDVGKTPLAVSTDEKKGVQSRELDEVDLQRSATGSIGCGGAHVCWWHVQQY